MLSRLVVLDTKRTKRASLLEGEAGDQADRHRFGS